MCLCATQLAVCKPKVSGHHYVRQQPPTAVPAKAKANISHPCMFNPTCSCSTQHMIVDKTSAGDINRVVYLHLLKR